MSSKSALGPQPSDRLDMAYINSLPQPLIGREIGGWEWPIHDIDVQTGLLRIDVMGKLQVKHIDDFTSFRDDADIAHPACGFYSDATPEERLPLPKRATDTAISAEEGKDITSPRANTLHDETPFAAEEGREEV